jgi:formamidopyrimidine-DNA glycosylase
MSTTLEGRYQMPELPEVETIVRGLRKSIEGRSFIGVSLSWPRQIATPEPGEFARRLSGQQVRILDRRGKYIVFQLTHDVLLIHLKMTGRLYITGSTISGFGEDRWVRAVFGLDNGHEMRFSDARKFGRLYLVGRADEITGPLGPEPLSSDFTLTGFQASLSRRLTNIKALLLNQRILAGVGNIYADEALWEARIAPQRKANTLKSEEVAALYAAVRLVLQRGIDYEGASVSWYRKADGSRGGSQNQFNVYDQEGKPCSRCGTPVVKIRLGQRGTHFCPVCQV